MDHRRWPSSPTGRPTGSASSNQATAAQGASSRASASRARPRPAAAVKFDRALGVRFVAGADEAGRGCLAGPLVAAAVLFDLERLGPARGRARSARSTTPSSRRHEARAELYPVILRAAAKVAIVSRCAPGIDARGLHVTNLAALRDALRASPCRAACASATASRSRRSATSSAP